MRVLERVFEGQARFEITRTSGADGAARTLIDVAIPAGGHNLRQLERELRDFVLPDLELDEGLRVRMQTRRDV